MKISKLFIAAVFLGLTLTSCNYLFEEPVDLEENEQISVSSVGQEKYRDSGQGKKCNYILKGSSGGYPAFSCSIMGSSCRCEGGSPIAPPNVDLETVKLFFPEVLSWDDLSKIDFNANEKFVEYLNFLRGE